MLINTTYISFTYSLKLNNRHWQTSITCINHFNNASNLHHHFITKYNNRCCSISDFFILCSCNLNHRLSRWMLDCYLQNDNQQKCGITKYKQLLFIFTFCSTVLNYHNKKYNSGSQMKNTAMEVNTQLRCFECCRHLCLTLQIYHVKSCMRYIGSDYLMLVALSQTPAVATWPLSETWLLHACSTCLPPNFHLCQIIMPGYRGKCKWSTDVLWREQRRVEPMTSQS